MGRSLLYLALLGLAVAGAVWALQRFRERIPAIGSTPTPAAALSGVVAEERATCVHGVDQGPGVLRLTDSQLVFTADTGRVLVLERLDIVGVGQTPDLPGRTLARPVLAVTTTADTYYFAVRSVAHWESLLT